MATQGALAARYANAFAQVAAQAGLDTTAARAQMREFATTLQGNEQLREVLTDPSIPGEQKLAVLDAMAERAGMYREVRNLLAVVMDNHRLGELSAIVAEYDLVADANQGIAEAEVTSARDLNGDDRAELEAQVARVAGSRVRISYRQDAALLGGAVVKIGSTVYDGSVRTQLEQLKQTLVKA